MKLNTQVKHLHGDYKLVLTTAYRDVTIIFKVLWSLKAAWYLLSMSKRVQICRAISLPHSSGFLFLSQLTALSLSAKPSKIKMAPIPLMWLSWNFLIGCCARESQQIVLIHCTNRKKARKISPDKPRSCRRLIWIHRHTSRQVKTFCRPTKKITSVWRPLIVI